jgi:hypothetical protein
VTRWQAQAVSQVIMDAAADTYTPARLDRPTTGGADLSLLIELGLLIECAQSMVAMNWPLCLARTQKDGGGQLKTKLNLNGPKMHIAGLRSRPGFTKNANGYVRCL